MIFDNSALAAAVLANSGLVRPSHSTSGSLQTGIRLEPRNALTIDLEDWYQGLEIPMGKWSEFEDRLAISCRNLLELLALAKVRATFFVLGYVAEQQPELVREIVQRGHEIGTHGYSHSFVYRQSPNLFLRELKLSIELLEQITSRKVIGHRAAFFSITSNSLWAIEALGMAGILYDSSIFPFRNYRYGIANAPRWPFVLRTQTGSITEFPLSTIRIAGVNIPIAGGAYFRLLPYFLTRAAFKSLNEQGFPVAFYLHPWELDPAHPRVRLPARVAATHYCNLKQTRPRLLRLLRDFQFAPMGEVLEFASSSEHAR
jgi:polysaccharide deacetylase family protein (PEP-CTERM system associated)